VSCIIFEVQIAPLVRKYLPARTHDRPLLSHTTTAASVSLELIAVQLLDLSSFSALLSVFKHKSRAIARKPRDAVRFGLTFADIQFKSSQAPKAKLQSSRHTGEKKQNLT